MPKKKPEVTTLEFSDGEIVEIAGSIRDIALNQQAETLEALGVSPAKIAKARAECVAQDSDKPFVELFKTVIKR